MRYAKLRGLIRERFGTQEAFAHAMRMHKSTLVKKLAGKSGWSLDEVQRATTLLGIQLDRVAEYFFAEKVA